MNEDELRGWPTVNPLARPLMPVGKLFFLSSWGKRWMR
jgi:hypothetical protein